MTNVLAVLAVLAAIAAVAILFFTYGVAFIGTLAGDSIDRLMDAGERHAKRVQRRRSSTGSK